MGQWKREMERGLEQQECARSILVDAKVAQPCPAHSHLVRLESEPTLAYKHAMARWKRDDELRALFDNTTRELTDAIKAAFETEVSDVCPHNDCPWPGP